MLYFCSRPLALKKTTQRLHFGQVHKSEPYEFIAAWIINVLKNMGRRSKRPNASSDSYTSSDGDSDYYYMSHRKKTVGDGGDPHHQCQSSTITEKIDQDLDHRVTCMTIKSTMTVGLQDQNMVSSNMIVVQMIG